MLRLVVVLLATGFLASLADGTKTHDVKMRCPLGWAEGPAGDCVPPEPAFAEEDGTKEIDSTATKHSKNTDEDGSFAQIDTQGGRCFTPLPGGFSDVIKCSQDTLGTHCGKFQRHGGDVEDCICGIFQGELDCWPENTLKFPKRGPWATASIQVDSTVAKHRGSTKEGEL
ncbi:unnamed protein product [Vitrella brassicaformis CCMP3155]|uniref:EGF-like domain-containing protein n=2 Tax=Vitrella brassicaformis TaxID=1169539 RepID=A0A0G4FAX7_VITBC|nr:unnamed protein product [Vitrella brassicaformis CCMP3155]|eukprot:CEM10066.1 unnamed protein product [Vitrella brassicaformis CCMP3155]